MPFLTWLSNVHINFKIAAIFLIVALVWLGCFSWIKLHDAKVRAATMLTCPPQIVVKEGGRVIQDQRVSKMWCIPFPAIAHFGLGFCHD